jgi:RNA polymerase sporulation-specific sigma factor
VTDKYISYTDEDLITLIKEGDQEATEYLVKKYYPLVIRSTRTMFLIGADDEDLTQEGLIGLFKAIQSYDSNNDASFFTFAQLCIKRQIYSAVKASNREKHSPLNGYISFYSSTNDNEVQLIENLEADNNTNPEIVILNQETTERINELLSSHLSKMEQMVLPLYLEGMSYKDIAQKLGKSTKSIDNAVSRIRDKVKNFYPSL